MESLAKNLKIARMTRGWTIAEAELHTGIKKVTIGSYERGYRLPPVDILQKLAADYETSVAWLIGEQCNNCATQYRIKELESQLSTLKEAK